ncbi:MAG: NAD-dependent deacylase [candidate division Zixibacteria bacterium]|nr:NAD-dependent deacylase [candidate division Zixibacteria bacterium]
MLTGAGISAESGVPTFRSADGLWNKFKPEELASMAAFVANPKMVWEWYNWRRELIANVKPNAGHFAIAELSALLPRFTLVTQNVDGLHALAGSRNIVELHGNIGRSKCSDCGLLVPEDCHIDPSAIPACRGCGGKIRPDVVWFGEMLDPNIIDAAFREAERCDLFLSVGTSALVHPAATLPVVAKRHGATLIEVNLEPTPLSAMADISVQGKSGDVLPVVVEALKRRHRLSPSGEPR